MNGLALTILIGQLPKLFGFSTDANGLINEASAFVHGAGFGRSSWRICCDWAGQSGVNPGAQRWLPRVPGVLVAVIVAIAAASVFDLASHGVSLVGTLPKGFPPLTVPSIESVTDLPLLVAGALGISLVALTDTISTASAFAARTGQEVDGNGEMIGIGAANVAASFFQGFAVSTSGSRTAVAEQAGAKTQITGFVGAAAIVLMLVFAPWLPQNLPNPTLAAVVNAASLSLADIPGTVRLWRQRRVEFLLSITAFLGVALLGVLAGIAVAVALSIINVFRRAWWPYQTTLGRVPGLPGQHDRRQHPEAEELPGLVIFRFDAPLFFANARTFRDQIRRLAGASPRPRWVPHRSRANDRRRHHCRRHARRSRRGTQRARHFPGIRRTQESPPNELERYELIGPLNPDHFFPTLDASIETFCQETGAEWTPPKQASTETS